MYWTKKDMPNYFYIISKKDVVLDEIVERISNLEIEMDIPENERWTRNGSLHCNIYCHVYEIIQRLGELEDSILCFNQEKNERFTMRYMK